MVTFQTMKWGTQKRLSKLTGYSEPYICNLLSGNRRPSWSAAKKLALVTNTKPELWLEGNPEEIKNALSNVEFTYCYLILT
jgi:transcriptional regulator with XRE-family HTH domain